MAGVIHEPWNLLKAQEEEYSQGRERHSGYGFSWEAYYREPSHNSSGPAYPHSQLKISRKSLWIDGQYNTCWVWDDVNRRATASSTHGHHAASTSTWAHHGELCAEVSHDKTLLCNDSYIPFVSLLRACAKNKDLLKGTRLHDDILKRGLLEECSDSLVTMYAKCGALAKAKELLDMHPSRNVFPWNALIAAYAWRGQGQDALNCFEQMHHEGPSPNAVTYSCILKACGSMKAANKGEQIHEEITRQGLLEDDIVLGNALVDMYVKCGALFKAQQVLAELPIRDVISWNALIAGYAQQDQGEQAIDCFEQMQREGISPDGVTFICILKAYGNIGAVEKGEQIHDKIARQGLLQNDIVLSTALVDMYAKCGALAKAQQVLEELGTRDVVAWNALIAGYAQQGQGEQALKCYERMQHEGLDPNAVTFSSILKACGSVGAVKKGEQIHLEIARQGLLEKNIVVGNAVIGMYAKCGALAKARRVLEKLPFRDVVSWNALIGGYVQEGEGEQALDCFEKMRCEGLSPSTVTFTCILKACGMLGAADRGKQIHDEIARQGLLRNDSVLGTVLVDMYAKCGALAKAQKVLQELPFRNVVPWNAIITGYAQQGQREQVLDCFRQMQRDGLSPDAVTFSCVLNACSHLGLVEDGHRFFVDMSTKYGIKPSLEHYTCMVDLFGRAGHLDKAVEMIQEISSCDDSTIWSALLDACRTWGDVNFGRWAFEQAIQVDKSDGAVYVLMANIYAAAGMQEDAENIEAMRMQIMHGKS